MVRYLEVARHRQGPLACRAHLQVHLNSSRRLELAGSIRPIPAVLVCQVATTPQPATFRVRVVDRGTITATTTIPTSVTRTRAISSFRTAADLDQLRTKGTPTTRVTTTTRPVATKITSTPSTTACPPPTAITQSTTKTPASRGTITNHHHLHIPPTQTPIAQQRRLITSIRKQAASSSIIILSISNKTSSCNSNNNTA